MTCLPERPSSPYRPRRHGPRFWIRSLAVVTLVSSAIPRMAASEEEQNRCGCYRDGSGSCFCSKKATCGCPGECEPRGCEEKREKDLQKEIQAETKKAEEAGRKKAPSKDDESGVTETPVKMTSAPPRRKLTPAQVKEFGKLLELYLSAHPGAGGKSLEDLRGDLAPAR